MLNFKAYFWGKDVYINEKFRYDSNEILTACLNDSRAKKVLKADFVVKLKDFKHRLTISPYMDYYDFSSYNKNVYSAMSSVSHPIIIRMIMILEAMSIFYLPFNSPLANSLSYIHRYCPIMHVAVRCSLDV